MGPASASSCSVCGESLGAKGVCFACLLRAGLDDAEEPGTPEAALLFDDFEIARREDGSLWELGRGGMGVTYRATEKTLHRDVALKVTNTRGSEAVRERFLREARAAAALRHPNVAGVFRFGALADSDRCYCAMELVEGETVEALVRRDGPLKLEAALEIAIQVTRALMAAAERGLVHRDLKPANIMLAQNGGTPSKIEVKVIDFGLAKATTDVPEEMKLTRGEFVGTPAFASPEQFAGGSIDARTDIYALGVTLWFALSGRLPFAGRTIEEIRHNQTRDKLPLEQLQGVPRRVIELLRSCLARDPEQRPASARKLLEALEACRAQLTSSRRPGKIAVLAAIAGVALGLAALMFLRNRSGDQPASAPVAEKSIAVLPFENLSKEEANEYFAAGIQDEILTRLAAVRDLKVISRTSTAKYKSKPEDLKKIARDLGVATILEGSVQKAGDKVRVTVQLIKAPTDSHLWAETFDRNLTDIFSVESEVAKTIADRLQAKLTGAEEQIIAAKPTENAEAYDAYLRGLAYSLKTANTTANATNAQKYLREAVRLDPKFALAWALLSYVESRAYRTEFLPPTVALREEARQAAETALTLQPNLGEAVLAKGFYHYACLRDYETAVRYFEQARPLLPNSSRIPESLAYVTRKQGQWDRSESYFNEAERLDPRNVSLLTQHALSYKDRRMFPEASRKLEQILNITPDDADTIVEKAVIAQAEGDLPRASALLAPLHIEANNPNAFETQVYQAILERQTAAITSRLQEIVAKPDPALGYTNGELRFWLGWAQEVSGDLTAAQETWRTARQELESFLREHPEDHILLGDLALTTACLGDKTTAFAFAEKAMAAVPIEKDAVSGPTGIEFLARVAARLGDADRALAALRKLLATSYSGALGPGAPLTLALLRLDPMIDPLRKDTRFEKLLAGEGSNAPSESASANASEKSIAVLPFDNLSEEKANEYFAAGVQDEILTRLAAVRDLKVISRTSTAKYKSKPDNLKTVAQELGVSTILEGSVQKSGDKVRINVQLIDARADTHLWAKSYDRQLKDVFAVESEVSQEIAESLRVKLAAQSDGVAPTNDTEAYDLFLRGEYEFHQAGISLDPGAAADRADSFYRRSLARDPNFAKPAAQLARSRLYRHWYTSPLTPAELEEVKSLIDRTLARAPNLPEAHLALGLFYYWGHRQYGMALAEFSRTLELQPNNSDAWAYCAWIHRRQAEWERSLAASQKAQELDPHDGSIPQNIGLTYLALRMWTDAERAELRALSLDPQNTVAAAVLVQAHLSRTGEASSARRALNDFPEAMQSLTTSLHGRRGVSSGGEVAAILGVWVYLDVTERHFADAFQAFEKAAGNDAGGHLQLLAGRVALRVLAGQAQASKSMAEEALPLLEARLGERPDDTFAMTELSWVYLALGRAADALRISRQAADLISIEKDALDGAVFQNGLAQIEARAGAPEEATRRLRRLLSIPAGQRISRARLKNDPAWDPIRDRADFQALLSGPEQVGPNK